MNKINGNSAENEVTADQEEMADPGILSPTRLMNPQTSAEFISFCWNIEAFDCLAANGSDCLIRSQTFKCCQKDQLTEWYLSLDYSPHLPGHLRSGIFLTTSNTKASPNAEVRVHACVFLTDSFGRPVLELGSVSRLFKAKDPVSVFRRFLDNESYHTVNEPRSESHEWFTPINLKQLWGNKDILLSDNTLRIRCLLEVEKYEIQSSKSQHLSTTNEAVLPDLPEVESSKSTCKTKTHTSEHSIFNDHVVQHSDHSPYGSNTFRSRRPQTAQRPVSRGLPRDSSSHVVSYGHGSSDLILASPVPGQDFDPSVNQRTRAQAYLTSTINKGARVREYVIPGPSRYDQRPYTAAVDMRRMISTRGPPENVNQTFTKFPQDNPNTLRPKSPLHIQSSSDEASEIQKISRNLIRHNLIMPAEARPLTRTGYLPERPKTALPSKYEYETQYNPNLRAKSKSTKELETVARGRGTPHVEIMYKAYPRAQTAPKLEKTRNQDDDESLGIGLDISNTDCAIICGNKKFSVHAEILRRSSPVFASVLKEAKYNAAQDSPECPMVPTIRSNDVEPAVMRKMLDYVYSGEVESKPGPSTVKYNAPKLTIGASRKLLHAAQKYQIRNLKEECLNKLLTDISEETVGELAVLAYDFNASSHFKRQIRMFLRSKWVGLQRNPAFRELYKRNPGAFAGVFEPITDDDRFHKL